MSHSNRHHPDFNAIPWCQALLDDPSYEHITPVTRVPDESQEHGNNSLMAKTLATDSTIRAIQYLYKPAQHASASTFASSDFGEQSHLIALISLGPGMTSHPDTLHGGMCATLVDEVGGALSMREAPNDTSGMLVNFNVNLRKSVKVPNVVVGRAWRDLGKDPGKEGRKQYIKCVIEQDGVPCVDAECLYLTFSTEKAKL